MYGLPNTHLNFFPENPACPLVLTIFVVIINIKQIVRVARIAAYFIYMNTDVEYEYLYVDRELSVDKIMGKSTRKRIANFDIEKMEILAPVNSYHLDNYKNRTGKTADYSSGEVMQPDKRYVFYYDGTQKVIFEPDAEMVKAIQMLAPRKVFKD